MTNLQLASEPQWILDRKGSGPLFWRRDCMERDQRVKFLHDVEIVEFSRSEHELELFSRHQDDKEEQQEVNTITMKMTAFVCIIITVFLPWYLIGIE